MVGSRPRAVLPAIAAIAAALAAAPAPARLDTRAATVNLQVVPRGPGSIAGGAEVGGKVCSASREPDDCTWQVTAGTPVTLTARPVGAARVSWSTPDCPGTAPCTLTLDRDTTIVALFGKLTLEVATSGADADDLVTSEPAGIHCPGTCEALFDAGTAVKLTTKSVAGSTFTSYPYGCEAVVANVCTLRILDEPQQVGVKFNGAQGPVAGPVVSVAVRVGKTGSGTGHVTAAKVDCGSSCSASYPYGTLVQFTAVAEGGSLFRGWGGVCASDATRCTLPIGPVTVVHPRFDPDAAPSAPGSPSASARAATSLTIAWSASTDDVGVKSYEVFVGAEGMPRATTDGTSATLRGLRCGTEYAIAVVAVDTAGNRSARATLATSTGACVLRIVPGGAASSGGRIACRFRSSTGAPGRAELAVGRTVLAHKRVVVHPGANTLVFVLPGSVRAHRVRVTLRVGARAYSWSVATGR